MCIFNKNKCDISTAEPADFQSIKLGDYKITYLPDGEGYTILYHPYHIKVQQMKIGNH